MNENGRKIGWLVAGAVVLAAIFFFAKKVERVSGGDPDRYYHFALSREMVKSGQVYLKTIPQVEGIGWDHFFPEKEFLFHQLTALAYRVGQDEGVIWSVWLMGLVGLLIFYGYASRRIGVAGGLLVTLAFFGTPLLVFRLLLVRPHVLAISAFVLVLLGAVRKDWRILFPAVIIFAFSYHAFYLPLLVLIAAYLALRFSGEVGMAEKKFLVLGAAALLIGVVLNPYFPANLISAVRIAYVPTLMAGKMSDIAFGAELYPTSTDFFLSRLLLPLLISVAAIWQLSHDWQKKQLRYETLLLSIISLASLWLSIQSKRGTEYFIPATAFLFLNLWERQGQRRGLRWLATGVGLCFLGSYGLIYANEFRPSANTRPAEMLAAAEALPAGRSGRVFNCGWDMTPYLYYARPEYRFLDILDPSYFYFADPGGHSAREKARHGEVGDVYGLLRNAFKADYVYCSDPNLVSQMERDARFRRLYPRVMADSDKDVLVFVYEIQAQPTISYVKDYEASFLSVREKDFRQADFRRAKERQPAHLTFSGYLDLAGLFKPKLASLDKNDALCASLRPDAKQLEGAEYLSLGGGRNIRVWKNGKPWFDSEVAFLTTGMHQLLLPLDGKLKGSDQIDLVVCSSQKAAFWGVSLAGLTETQVAEICAWKQPNSESVIAPYSFQYGRSRQSCLGSLALPTLSTNLKAPK